MKTNQFGVESGAGAFFGKALVVEYDDARRLKVVLSIHDSQSEAEEHLALARAGRHSTQLWPGGILLAAGDDVRPW